MARISGAALLALELTFCGCLSRQPVTVQTFAFSAPTLAATNPVAADRVLELKTLRIAPPFNGRSLIYRTGEFSYKRDPYAGFLGIPAEGLAGPVSAMLRTDGHFSAVVEAGSAVQPDMLAEITVNQLYGDIRQPRSPYAVLELQTAFLDATNGFPGRVILQREYSRRIPIRSSAPSALMKGWSQALVGILAQATADLRHLETAGRRGEEHAPHLAKQ